MQSRRNSTLPFSLVFSGTDGRERERVRQHWLSMTCVSYRGLPFLRTTSPPYHKSLCCCAFTPAHGATEHGRRLDQTTAFRLASPDSFETRPCCGNVTALLFRTGGVQKMEWGHFAFCIGFKWVSSQQTSSCRESAVSENSFTYLSALATIMEYGRGCQHRTRNILEAGHHNLEEDWESKYL